MRSATAPSLARTAVAGLVVIFLAVAFVVLVPLREHLRSYERDLQSETMHRSGEALRLTVSRLIDREWDSLAAVAREIGPSSYRATRSFVDAAARASEAVTWAGFITPGGVVEAGSGGQYEGVEVGDRRWFRNGRERSSVSGVRRPAGPEGGETEEGIVILSMPVLDRQGQSEGLLVYSIGLRWMRGVMSRSAEELDVDMAVVDREGEIILSRLGDGPLESRAAAISRLGTPVLRLEEGGDGEEYLMQSFPELLTEDVPPFDWSLVVQVPAAPAAAGLGAFLSALRWSWLALFVLIAGSAALYIGVFLRPVQRLAREADRIASGELVDPTESLTSEESQRLGRALPVFQSRLDDYHARAA